MKLSELYVGLKVRIHRYDPEALPDHWNEDGEMNQWMGRIVTINHIHQQYNEIYVEEDGGLWSWKSGDFANPILTKEQQTNPNHVFKLRWRFM